jgi:hypothetical protein
MLVSYDRVLTAIVRALNASSVAQKRPQAA